MASQESLLVYDCNQVNDKVYWQPQGLTWKLNFEGGEEAEKTYCRENNITLCVSEGLDVVDFALQRQTAFRDACRVWNAVDRSGRRRIHLVDVDESGVAVVLDHAISQRWETDLRL